MALVLDRQTGFVSPQFHVAFDPSFHTVKDDKDESLWQARSGFVTSTASVKPVPEQVPAALPKRAHFALTPSPEGAPARRSKRHKQQSNNSTRKAPPEGDIPNPQLQLPPAREKEKAPGTPGPTTAVNPGPNDRTSGQKSHPVECLIEVMMAETSRMTTQDIEGEIFCLQAMFPHTELDEDPLMAYKAFADPDTMYLHQA